MDEYTPPIVDTDPETGQPMDETLPVGPDWQGDVGLDR